MGELTVLAQQQNGGDGGALGGGLAVLCLLWALGLAAFVFWAWMLIDALTRERETNDKILWFLVIFFLSFPGALVYYFVRKRGRAA